MDLTTLEKNKIFDRYLDILGLSRKKPSLDALNELVPAHLRKIPFENISKLYSRKTADRRNIPSLDEYLDGIERFNFGGTCYTNNYYMNLLLNNLGYNVKLCGAKIAKEGTSPNGHMISIVNVDGSEYIVDVGYAAPFHVPLPRDLREDFVIEIGADSYVLKPQDSGGYSHLEYYRRGQLKHGYMAKPVPMRVEQFADVISDSYGDKALFLNAIILARFFPNRMLTIRNFTMIELNGPEMHITELNSLEETVHAIQKYFNIPSSIALTAISGMGELRNPWA
ncbi:MAG: arylamine N-acetyltransferase [Candidatus Zixiibacteriota bacterium]